MTTKILATKTGNVNMGGYFIEKTARVYTVTHVINGVKKTSKWFRFGYIGDRTDNCYETIEEAMMKFEKEIKSIN